MRGVAITFLSGILLTACVSQSKYERVLAQNNQLQRDNAALQQQSAAQSGEISQQRGQIGRLEGAVKYTVESDLLFKSGSWEMTPQGRQTLAQVARQLAPTQKKKLVVHGYTDDTPIGDELEREGIASNEVLSQKRAEAVRATLISYGVRPDLIMAVGHGAANPVASNDSAEGRAKNRRVELTLGT
jgi:outer membrane protein OmpA-like peptidoglycan-associated protein